MLEDILQVCISASIVFGSVGKRRVVRKGARLVARDGVVVAAVVDFPGFAAGGLSCGGSVEGERGHGEGEEGGGGHDGGGDGLRR